MTPEKTGAYIYLEEYGEYVVGDLYKFGNGPVLKSTRSVPRVYEPEQSVVHGVCSRIETRWEFHSSGMEVILMGDFLWFGYDGLRIDEFAKRYFVAAAVLGRLLDNR